MDGNNRIQAPVPVISFRQQAAQADKQFYEFLAREMDTDEVDAINHFRDYTEDLKTKATAEPGTELQEIGHLAILGDGSVVFKAGAGPEELLPAVQLPDGIVFESIEPMTDILGKNNRAEGKEAFADTSETKTGNTNWWIYAAILLLIGIGIILFYYA